MIEAGTYRVHMWLFFKLEQAGENKEFNLRFPKQLADSWWDLEFDVTGGNDLANKMNAQIVKDCAVWLKKDMGQDIKDVSAFSAGSWSPGGGGQHEGEGQINIIDPAGLGTWTFGTYTMYAKCRIMEK